MPHIAESDKKHLIDLFKPSGLSAVMAFLIGFVLTGSIIVAFSFNNSEVQQQLIAWQQKQPERPLTTPDQTLPENDRPTLAGSWPLLVVWGGIGLFTYFVAASIIHSVSNMYQLRKSLDYVNAQPRSLLETAAEHIALRLLASAILIGLVFFFFKQVIPYSISASRAAAGDLVSGTGILYSVLSFAVIAVCLHLQTIFLRLSLGRIRVFSELQP